jgi:CheY-like chemotaxis protein
MIDKPLTVLAVDDDVINLKLLKSMLLKNSRIGNVIEAHNGADAIEILKANKEIDLILLDIIMPVMGGIEMLQVVRADDSLQQLPIIVLTTDETKKAEALNHGANGFLMKPVRAHDLTDQIEKYIL